MPILKGNLHTHTTFSDGAMEPLAVLEAYRSRGYDFVALTDHRCFLGPGPDAIRRYWDKLPRALGDLIVLHGYEEEPPEINARHLGIIRAGTEELRILNHPSEYQLSIAEVITMVARSGAHVVEVTHHGRLLHEYDVPEIGVPLVATDDAHHEGEIGVSWIEVDADTRDAPAILRAIKLGRFQRHIGRE